MTINREIRTFLVLTFLFSSFFYYLVGSKEQNGWYFFGLMWCPGVAAMVTSFIYKGNLKNFGWRITNVRILLGCFMFPIFELCIVYGVIWQFSLGGFAGFENNFITSLTVLPMILMILEGMYFAGRSALGEEIGWRGFLVPRLLESNSPNKVSLLVGGIWALWHFPLFLIGEYGSETPILFQMICFGLMIVGSNFVYTWFRIKSANLWSGVLLHTTGNLFIFHVFEDLTTNTGNTASWAGETGIVFAYWGGLLIGLFLKFGWDWPTLLYSSCKSRFGKSKP